MPIEIPEITYYEGINYDNLNLSSCKRRKLSHDTAKTTNQPAYQPAHQQTHQPVHSTIQRKFEPIPTSKAPEVITIDEDESEKENSSSEPIGSQKLQAFTGHYQSQVSNSTYNLLSNSQRTNDEVSNFPHFNSLSTSKQSSFEEEEEHSTKSNPSFSTNNLQQNYHKPTNLYSAYSSESYWVPAPKQAKKNVSPYFAKEAKKEQPKTYPAKAPSRYQPQERSGFVTNTQLYNINDESQNSNSSVIADSQRNDGDEHYLKNSNFPHSTRLKQLFAQYFKFKNFRTNQYEAINAACLGLDTLILMPTGGGKSICYQLPAIVCEGLTIVVSPLKSLIEDQVNKLRSLSIKTSALSGETDPTEADYIYMDLRSSRPTHKLLYVTPEKVNSSGMLMSLFEQLHRRQFLSRFVIDEAHCVSMWGSDFRPDYRKLGILRTKFPNVPIMALTATAPPKVRLDILNQLHMDAAKSKVFLQSFNRPNLRFEVRKKTKQCLSDVVQLINDHFEGQSGIIYCLSRNECETLAGRLREEGISSTPYHAGLNDERRRRVFKSWAENKTNVVCATIAFGMGIDKADVRFVIHYSMPKSIEGYYQEAGRAGRDGNYAHCILYYTTSDIYRMKALLRGSKTKADKERDKYNLDSITNYCSNVNECRRTFLLRYLGEQFDRSECLSNPRTSCDNCRKQKR